MNVFVDVIEFPDDTSEIYNLLFDVPHEVMLLIT